MIVQHKIDFRKLVDLSLSYSEHILTTKNLLAMLTDSTRFHIDSGFEQLNPKYNITPADIEAYIKQLLKLIFKISV